MEPLELPFVLSPSFFFEYLFFIIVVCEGSIYSLLHSSFGKKIALRYPNAILVRMGFIVFILASR